MVHEFAFLDDGSNVTLIDRDLFDRLSLAGTRTTLRMSWTQDVETVDSGPIVTTIHVSSLASERPHRFKDVSYVANLNLPSQSIITDSY